MLSLNIIIYNFSYTGCIYFLSHDTQPSLFACTVTKLSWRLEERFQPDLCVGSGFPACFGVLPCYHELILQIVFWNPPPPLSGASIDLSKTRFLLLGIYGVENFPPNNFNNYPKYGILLTERTLNQVKWRCALPVCCQAAQIPTIPISLSVRVLGWLFPLHSLLGWLQVPRCLPDILVNTAAC